MGYNTNFDLNYKFDEFIDDGELITNLNEITGYDWDYEFTINGKWYDWKDDMLKLTKVYPDVLFVLTGEGEEAGDLWKAYFKNGKVQHAKATIVYDEFDESKMK